MCKSSDFQKQKQTIHIENAHKKTVCAQSSHTVLLTRGPPVGNDYFPRMMLMISVTSEILTSPSTLASALMTLKGDGILPKM